MWSVRCRKTGVRKAYLARLRTRVVAGVRAESVIVRRAGVTGGVALGSAFAVSSTEAISAKWRRGPPEVCHHGDNLATV